jgi:SH3 domain-containing YSC84-like protein 1
MKKLYIAVLGLGLLATSQQLLATEQGRVDQAAAIVQRFRALPEKQIPHRVLRDAKGVAILTVVKGGFIFSGRAGEGVLLARTKSGWSGPSFVRTGGAGYGLQIGGNVTEFVLVLNTPAAVSAFSKGGNVQLGGQLSAAAGPMGRTAEAGVMPKAAVYTYSRSQGLFAGVSLEGTVIAADNKANERYYGKRATAQEILSGQAQPPRGAATLRRAL